MKFASFSLISAAAIALSAQAELPAPPQEPVIYDAIPAPCGAEEFTIYFEQGVTDLGDHAKAVLDAVADDLARCNYHRVEVAGYTDASGPASLNKDISNDRAHAVVDALKARNIAGDTVAVMATGEARAMNVNGYVEPLNRKVTVQLVPRRNTVHASL